MVEVVLEGLGESFLDLTVDMTEFCVGCGPDAFVFVPAALDCVAGAEGDIWEG